MSRRARRNPLPSPPPSSPPATAEPAYGNAFEKEMHRLGAPEHMFSSEELHNDILLSMGFAESELAEQRQEWHRGMNDMFERAGRRINVIGGKPVPGDRIFLFNIPHDTLSIRLFDGGLKEHGLFCLDFVQTSTGGAVNSPDKYRIYTISHPGRMSGPSGHLVSWEEGQQITRQDILPGEERFSIFEGTPCKLARPDREDFFFMIPIRPGDIVRGQRFAPGVPAVFGA